MKTLFAVLFLSALSFGSTTCQSTFNVASGTPGAFSFCVTENGNVAYLNTGLPQISDGAEGYAMCWNGGGYWDLGLYGDSGNWLPAVITQPGGPDTFPLTITRTTADYTFTLTQEFSVAGSKSIRVKMSATGVSGYRINTLYRFAHIQPHQSHADSTARSAFVLSSRGYGLMAIPALTPRVGAGVLDGGAPADICSPQAINQLPYSGDAATLLGWTMLNTKKNSVSFDYVPMR